MENKTIGTLEINKYINFKHLEGCNYGDKTEIQLMRSGGVCDCGLDDFKNKLNQLDKVVNFNSLEAKTESNANLVSDFIEHCKSEGLNISDNFFESYFDA